jgi:hypothetical protein
MRSALPILYTLPLVLALVSCATDGKVNDTDDSGDGSNTDTYVAPTDNDADGITPTDGDCDDNDANVYPGRGEDCDGVDNNCNGQIDEGFPSADGDDGVADCVDVEDCDGVDNNGDGQIDEGFADDDGDGVADCVGTERCDGVDNDGDGDIDEGYDVDGDGYTQCGSATEDADCDDSDADINPGASETDGDRVDNNCDGVVDDSHWSEGDLAISEIMNNPGAVADPDGEWFEVYNTTDRQLILNGLVIADSSGEEHQVRSAEILTIDPGGFFVFGTNGTADTNGNVDVGYVYTDVTLSNESDDIELYADGILIDEVMWDDGATMPDPNGASMGTDFGNYSSVVNDDPNAWCAATMHWTDDPTSDKGSPGGDNEYCTTYDHDGDGYNGEAGDCDDSDPTTYPGAPEGTDPADNDCDGVAETAPVAVASATSSGYTCDTVTLDGSGSYDLEGAAVTYSWELTGAPATSTRTTGDINTTTSMSPTFSPDVEGTYTFTLTVNDGGTDSLPVSVDVVVTTRPTESDPVAYAGPDQSSSGTASCTPISYGASYSCDECSASTYTLDASGSTDADGDAMTYAWSVVSGSTYGSLSSSTGSSTTLTISGITAVYSTGDTETVEVQLTATDCMGASSTDLVDVTYTCTGT